MGYRYTLVVRWSRRDRLAVLVVALSVAFVVGTALVTLAAGAQLSGLAAAYDAGETVSVHDSPETAQHYAGGAGVVLPFAEATGPDGESTVVVARPDGSAAALDLGLEGDGVTLGTLTETTEVELRGTRGSVTVTVEPRRGEGVLPARWVVAPPETVDALGPTGALVVRPDGPSPGSGTPLIGALSFFRLATGQALRALWVGGIAAGVLVTVTVFGVTRIGVRERLGTIRIARATGATARTVLALYAIRGGLLTAAGAALGYALGVILPNAAVSVAVTTGQPVSLPLAMTPRTATVLLPVVLAPVAVGTLAGALAAYPAATRPPGLIDDPHVPAPDVPLDGWRRLLRPRVLDRRLVVPTAATLAAFVVIATVVAGLGTAMAPVSDPDMETVVEPDAPHPFASQVPEAYADALMGQGVEASGEILLLEVVDGRPFLAVGADFERFAAVHEATLVEGRAPAGPDEAVIGTALVAALDVGVGDRLVLGGSTRRGLAVVRVVGRYDAPGATAGQLVVGLETARELAGVREGMVHLVAAEELPSTGGAGGGAVGVVDVSVPDRVPADSDMTVEVTVRNEGLAAAEHEVTVRYRGGTTRRIVEVGSFGERTVAVELPAGPPGERTVVVGDVERAVRVVEPSELTITGLPAESPPDGRPLIRVMTLAGVPVANATVTVDGDRFRTDDQGRTRIALPQPGEARVVVSAGNRTASETVSVREGAERALQPSLVVRPSEPSVLVRPTARVRLSNPWAVPIERTVSITGSRATARDDVAIAPGETWTYEVALDRRPAGTYEVALRLDGAVVAQSSYTVTGDDRLAAALASSGRTGTSGVARAIEAALGNLRLVVATVAALAGLMTVGATAATFAAGVHARRRTLGVHRATGAGPRQLCRMVLADALKIGVVSTAIGLTLGLGFVAVFAHVGLLTVIGVQLPSLPSAPVLGGLVVAALGLTFLGAGIATVGVLRATPTALLAGDQSNRVDAGVADE